MKDLTEASTFDSPITVPEHTDDGYYRTANVEAIAQKLANRTRSLKAVTDHAARTDVNNTFAGTQTFSTINSTTTNAGTLTASHITSTHEIHANNDVTAGSDVIATGGVYGAFVTSTGPIQGTNLIATGTLAVSGASTLTGTVTAANGITVSHGNVSIATGILQVAGTTGTTFVVSGGGAVQIDGTTNLNGVVNVNNHLSTVGGGNYIASGANITSVTDILAGTSLAANTTVEAKGGNILLPGTQRVTYTGTLSDRTRQRVIPLCDGVSVNSAGTYTFDGAKYTATNASVAIGFPIAVPNTGQLLSLDVYYDGPTGMTVTVYVTTANYSSTPITAPTVSTIGTATFGAVAPGPGNVVLASVTVGYTVNNANDNIFVKVFPTNGGSLYGIRQIYSDPGPRSE